MNSISKNLLLLIALGGSLAACKKDEETPPSNNPPVNEEELITTLLLTFTDQEIPANAYELRFTDVDGDGGIAPVIQGDTLPANRAFNLTVRVLDESGATPEEITAEIEAEDEDHQFFFRPTGTTLLVNYVDSDANGLPVGLIKTASTAAPGSGTLTVTLRHLPNKSASGVSAGDITNAGGETDIEVDLPVIID